jgi:hypothetical protein
MVPGDHPRHHPAEVVTHEVELRDAEGVGDEECVPYELSRLVRGDLARSRTRRVAPLIERDGSVTVVSEGVELADPASRGLGKPVEQDDDTTLVPPRATRPK